MEKKISLLPTWTFADLSPENEAVVQQMQAFYEHNIDLLGQSCETYQRRENETEERIEQLEAELQTYKRGVEQSRAYANEIIQDRDEWMRHAEKLARMYKGAIQALSEKADEITRLRHDATRVQEVQRLRVHDLNEALIEANKQKDPLP